WRTKGLGGVMDIQKIKELALANGFSLKLQASGNMDLNAYVYEFANAIEQEAKAQAVPEGFAIKDVINERQRQINQEFYSTENDDEYEQNELLRAAVCYAENVVRRGWVFDSNFGPDVYQEEEVPDLWPWDLDFWKPKNPRRDLVRAAALIIAEIERIDRSTGASQ
ncbi:hypothetical protein, partial [Acinetobacter sp. YH01020]|uniref:hypothetical protein n=1 Tax=Acinetobacter sp. YH01020 TaxID=2601034 RepID=UPI00211EDF5C